jgi:hypothetical protein
MEHEPISDYAGPTLVLRPGDDGPVVAFQWLSNEVIHLTRSQQGRADNAVTVYTERESVFDLVSGKETRTPLLTRLRQIGVVNAVLGSALFPERQVRPVD